MATASAKQELKTVNSVRDQAAKGPDAGIANAVEIGNALTVLVSDMFALYLKTKNFHWHVSGPHFREYHLLLDDQAAQIFAIIDPIAERARKIGQPTLRSVEQVVASKRLQSSDAENLSAEQMLSELHADNQALAAYMRSTHTLTSEANDVATTSLLEEWIDQAEERAWFLGETLRNR